MGELIFFPMRSVFFLQTNLRALNLSLSAAALLPDFVLFQHPPWRVCILFSPPLHEHLCETFHIRIMAAEKPIGKLEQLPIELI